MEGLQMLSGSQLVAKGATKRVDGKLPESGLKEVSPSGSWLEQKQIQSALEARKHVIEVERIEKTGSLSHAVWRDDLKLAEVTQQTGSYWQYIGHSIGKKLFLRPEEALFLIEVNCLLLKHNDVTVSLQKAYSLCLGDISVAQYKVYASLSRLGYRVFRHKEPALDNKRNIQSVSDENIATNGTAPAKHPLRSETVSNNIEKLVNSIPQGADQTGDDVVSEDKKCGCFDDAEIKTRGSFSTEVSNDVPDIKIEKLSVAHSDNECDCLVPFIDADNIKVEIDENHAGSEIIENDINSAIEKTLRSSGIDPSDEFKGNGDEILPIDQESCMPACNENVVNSNVNENNSIQNENDNNATDNQDVNMLTNNEDAVPNICLINTCLKTLDDTAAIDVDDNANETIVTTTENNENITTNDRTATGNEPMETESSNMVMTGVVYSVDEFGVIRVFGEENPVVIEVADPYIAETNDIDPGSGTNDSIKHYEKDIQHYEIKKQKLLKRKANADCRTDLEGFNTMQDFYHQDVVSVKVPDEKYLPRNIFLHKAAYVLNMDIVRNQNALNANVSGDEADQIESPTRADRGTDAPSLADLPRFVANPPFNGPPRYNSPYPPYRPNVRPPNWVRHSYNAFYNFNSARQQNYFFHPRYRFQPQPFVRQHLLNYNENASRQNEMRKRNAMKVFHFNTIVNIATRFRSGLDAPSQIQALKNLLRSFNSHYDENYELTPNFEIIESNVRNDREVIVIDDDAEPSRKKQRLSDSSELMNNNLETLKSLATKLKDLHVKNLAVSRHRRVFSNAIKAFNKSFNADLYLDANFGIKDKKLIVLDSSSDSDVVVTVKEKDKTKKKIKLNPFNILKRVSRNVNDGASTSREVPILQQLSLNVINEDCTSRDLTNENNKDTDSPVIDNSGDGLLKYFHKAWLPGEEDFGRAELCSRRIARLDLLLFEAEYLYGALNRSAEFQGWLDVKIAILKEIQGSIALQKQQAIALSNDFFLETESQIQPIIGPECTDPRSALTQLAIIPTNKEIPAEASLKIDFDVYDRDIHFKKTNPPKPHFRVICLDELAPFPASDDVVALQAKYDDGIPKVFAFIGTSSISYLQVNPTDLPVVIPDNDPA